MPSRYRQLIESLSAGERERLRQALRLMVELLLAETPLPLGEPDGTDVVPSERPNVTTPADLDAA